jgi:C-methyltransferase C-terminal domain/Putative zinc binding domain/Methyltransferase domain
MSCRICKSKNLFKFLDIGHHPPSDQFRKKEQLNDAIVFYPLDVYLCENCGFVQLGYVVPPEILYQDNYPYESSTTETGKIHYHDFAKSVVENYKFTKEDLAVDIGSNVGVLLEGFKLMGLHINGIDPAPNICEIAEKRGIPTINDFFGKISAQKVVDKKGKASVITGTNVFAHVDDLESFMKAIQILIDEKKGIFIIESPHFLHLVKNLEYDTIYHEHLSYISIEPLVAFFEKFGMEIIKVEQKDIHGGSIRIFISNKGNYPIHSSVDNIINLEKKEKLRDKNTLLAFATKVIENKAALNQLIQKLKSKGNRVVAVSAPAKGMTLLNYCKLDNQTLDYVTEKSKLKIGLYTPGSHIPVVPDSQLLEDMPDYALLLAWNFAKEIMSNNKEYIKRGGKFIIPIPKPEIF